MLVCMRAIIHRGTCERFRTNMCLSIDVCCVLALAFKPNCAPQCSCPTNLRANFLTYLERRSANAQARMYMHVQIHINCVCCQCLLHVWPKASCGAIPLFWLCSLLLGSCLHLQVVLLLLKLAPCCSGSGVPPSLSEWIVARPMLTTCWIPSAAFRLQERQVLQILLQKSQSAATLILWKTWAMIRGQDKCSDTDTMEDLGYARGTLWTTI